MELKVEAGEVHVYLGHSEAKEWGCPECGALCRLYDHQPERRWRHLDTCQYQTILHAQPPRSECERQTNACLACQAAGVSSAMR